MQPAALKAKLVTVLLDQLGEPDRRERTRLWWRCPFHADDTPSFGVNLNMPEIYHCFGCGVSGDVFDFLKARMGMSFAEATRYLGGVVERQTVRGERTTAKAAQPPDAGWQAAGWEFVQKAQKALGARAALYLGRRRVWLETALRAGLGYWQGGETFGGNALPESIIVPRIMDGVLWAIQARAISPTARRRYGRVQGGSEAPYLPASFQPLTPTVVTEGEFDALVAWQAMGYRWNVLTTGSASAQLPRRWLQRLAEVPVVVVPDNDNAGKQYALRLKHHLPHAVVRYPPVGKDLTDCAIAGLNITEMLKQTLFPS